MAEVPVTIRAIVYPKNKSVEPFPATIMGLASITGLQVGGGPVIPPPDVQPEPPLVIWGGGNEPFPTPPIEIPDVPPEGPGEPSPIVKEGWNWSQSLGQWVYVYVPGKEDAQPKGRRDR